MAGVDKDGRVALKEGVSGRNGGQQVLVYPSSGCLPGPSSQLDSASILDVYKKWQPPNDEQARQRYHQEHIQHQSFDVGSSELSDFREFGAGHMLYFYFLKHMAFVCCALAICPGIPIIMIYSGGGFLANATDFEATSLGNFGAISTNNSTATLDISLPSTNNGADAELVMLQYLQSTANSPAVMMSALGFNKRNALIAASVMNLLGMVAYFAASLYFVTRTRTISKEVDQRVTSLPDYTVSVAGLPPDAEPEEVSKYFQEYGDVSQVECARNFHVLLEVVTDRRKVLDELDVAVATLQRAAELAPQVDESLELEVLNLQYDLSLLTEAIKARQLTRGGADVVRAYVTFRESVGRTAALAAQPRSMAERWQYPPEKRFRNQHLLSVTQAPEVTDIKFEHLEFRTWRRFVVRSTTWAIKILAVVVGFVLVSLAPNIKRNAGPLASAPSVTDCDANCQWKDAKGALYLNDTMRSVYKTCYDTGVYANLVSCQGASICYECFCKTALSRSMYEEVSYCSGFKNVLLQATAAQALTVVSIVAVNAAVTRGIQFITRYELHRTRTREGWSAMVALFITQFINTGLSILIANAYMPRLQESLSEHWRKILFGGVYPDTTPNWYREVGKAVVVSHIIGIPVRLALIYSDCIWVWYQKRTRQRALTQTQLNEAYQGHDFELAPRYGEQLAVLFVGLMFSAGLPLMYFSLAVNFVCHYWLEKYELLKVCKYPNSMDSALATSAAHALPFAALGQLLGGAWMISVIATPRSKLMGDSWVYHIVYGICSALSRLWSATNGLSVQQMADRLANAGVAHLLYGLVIMAIVLTVFFTLQSWIALYQSMKSRMSSQVAPDGTTAAGEHLSVPEFPLAVRSQLIVGPTSYDVRCNPNYKHVFERLEDLQVSHKTMDTVEAAELEARKHMAQNFRDLRRRRRRERARAVLQTDGPALVAYGFAANFTERLSTAASAQSSTKPAVGKNQVLPWPGAGDGVLGGGAMGKVPGMYGEVGENMQGQFEPAAGKLAGSYEDAIRQPAQLDMIGTGITGDPQPYITYGLPAQPYEHALAPQSSFGVAQQSMLPQTSMGHAVGGMQHELSPVHEDSMPAAEHPYATMAMPAHAETDVARAHGSRLRM